eukprot:TRINITY_DN17184_c0_g1_i1.p1 TRINITY_DN17184_c0_g1~~TRINITY_DN17184_c0_g1_i1.p1  ORF type:complete len:271 (+),score=64.31 TRINITY_DN17184_c0_g1_i1:66-815(+)
MGNVFKPAGPPPHQDLKVLLVGTGPQLSLCIALQIGSWPPAAVSQQLGAGAGAGSTSAAQIEVANRRTSLWLEAFGAGAPRNWAEEYPSRDVVLFVLDDREEHSLDLYRKVAGNPALITKQVLLVIISRDRASQAEDDNDPRGRRKRVTVTSRLNDEDDSVTAMRAIYVNPRDGDGLEDLLTAICRRAPEPVQSFAAADGSPPAVAALPTAGTVVAPQDLPSGAGSGGAPPLRGEQIGVDSGGDLANAV